MKNLRPAIISGGKTNIGKEGSHHDDLNLAGQRGFVTGAGEFLPRSKATDWVRDNQPHVYVALKDKGALHTTEYNEAIKEVRPQNDSQPREAEKETQVTDIPANVDNLKSVSDVTACVVDYGTFICLPDKLGEKFKKVYYYTPTSDEFYSMADLVKASGLDNVERINDIFEPELMASIDLFIFPDIGYAGLQKHLRSIGKAVWGSLGADELEILRDEFLSLMKKLDLPVIHSETIKGVANLRKHLEKVKNKYIKVNTYRGNMETWHHINIEHSKSQLTELEMQFGGLDDTVTFVVQDYIKTDVETGYDGWCIDGKFPSYCSQGYEKKNELYLSALAKYKDLPEQIRMINDALSPLLKKYKYRNFIATEIRIKDGISYFIDPTFRMPGMSGEQFMETCDNICEVIWYGANGILIEPEFNTKFLAAATIYHTDYEKGKWMVMDIPEEVRPFAKLWHYCKHKGLYHWPPKCNNELGLVLGSGDTIEASIKNLMKNTKQLKSEPVEFRLHGFRELIKDIEIAEKFGVKFTDQKIPGMSSII